MGRPADRGSTQENARTGPRVRRARRPSARTGNGAWVGVTPRTSPISTSPPVPNLSSHSSARQPPSLTSSTPAGTSRTTLRPHSASNDLDTSRPSMATLSSSHPSTRWQPTGRSRSSSPPGSSTTPSRQPWPWLSRGSWFACCRMVHECCCGDCGRPGSRGLLDTPHQRRPCTESNHRPGRAGGAGGRHSRCGRLTSKMVKQRPRTNRPPSAAGLVSAL
jgi:hypothetical protein